MNKSILYFCLISALGTLCSSHPAAALDISTSVREYYSESAFLGRQGLVANQSWFRLRQELATPLSVFFQVGTEAMTLGSLSSDLDSGSSFAYGSPGLRLAIGRNVQLLTGLRIRGFYARTPIGQLPGELLDARIWAVFGDYAATRFFWGKSTVAFAEPYAEAVFTSADKQNVILSAFFRMGFRWRPLSDVSLDAYLEPFVTLDRVGHYYNNLAEVRPTVRLQYATSLLTASVTGSWIRTAYFSRGQLDANPYADRTNGVRVQAVLGGSF